MRHHVVPPRPGVRGGPRCCTAEVRRWLLSNPGPYAGCALDPAVLHFITSYAEGRGAAALALYLRRFESAGVAASGTITLVRVRVRRDWQETGHITRLRRLGVV